MTSRRGARAAGAARGAPRTACGPRRARRRAAASAAPAYMNASGKSSETPPPPCTWMARSTTRRQICGTANLMPAISVRACWLPTVSISQAVFITSSRAISISIRDSAIQSRTLAFAETGRPNVSRCVGAVAQQLERPLGGADRPHAVVDAARAEPRLGDRKPMPSPAEDVLDRARGRPRSAARRGPRARCSRTRVVLRSTVTPGRVERDEHHRLLLVGRRRRGSVLPIAIRIRQFGCSAPVVHHLRPLSTYSSPSRSIRIAMLVASELATSGSVIAKPERISPSSSGRSQRSCCSAVPKCVQHLHVAGVGRRAVAGLGGDPRPAHDLGQRRVVGVASARRRGARRGGTGSTARAGAPRP